MLGNVIDPQQFIISLQRRLRLPVYNETFYCPFCNSVMNTFGDHSLVCPAGGDRSIRHNLLRDAVFNIARAAGARPESEKPGLLRPRPQIGSVEEDGVQFQGSLGPAARRPADVYLPSFDGGHRTALDFACTSGIRCGFTFLSARDGSAATVSYEARKCKFLDTEALCKRENIVFTPCVCEASGGSWGPIARRVFATLANSAAKFTGDNPSRKLEEILQTLSVILQRANALAILVRSPPSPPTQAGARTALVNAEIRRSAMDIDTDALQSV